MTNDRTGGTMTIKMSDLGGFMYGDGTYVVSFDGGRDTQAPLTATVFVNGPADTIFYEVTLPAIERKPSAKLAERIVKQIKTTPVAEMADAGIARDAS
jgi:hypothetical protein